MNKSISVPNTTARNIFKLMKVLAIGPKTRDQIKSAMELKKVPSDTIIAAERLGFIEKVGEKLRLLEKYEKLAEYDENHPQVKTEFEIAFNRFKPFNALIKIIKINGAEIKKKELSNLLKAEMNADWKASSEKQYVNKLVNWGSFCGILTTNGELVKIHPKYMSDSISIENSALNIENIFNKYLYDTFCESNINELIKNLKKDEDELTESKKLGDKFEKLVTSYFKLLGFSTRKVTGKKEKKVGLSYTSKDGGGDLGLFVHLPIHYHSKNYNGISIACELKATKSGAPKKAVDQVRTFSEQIKKLFPDYLIFRIVISQSISYEPVYARRNAEPDIVHVPFEVIKYLIKRQEVLSKNDEKLITPTSFVNILDYAIKNEILELTLKYVNELLNKHD